jgi:hypothetical protein
MSSNCNSSQSLIKLELSRQISKNFLNIKFHKISSMGIELLYAEEQTDREITKILVCFVILRTLIKNRFETGKNTDSD